MSGLREEGSEVTDGGALRRRAERSLLEVVGAKDPSPDQLQVVIHELQVHQLELQMQNEELRRTQLELETSRARYQDLYELAPVGYLHLDPQGLIRVANLRAADFLGVMRSQLVGQSLGNFVAPGDADAYFLSHRRVVQTRSSGECGLVLARPDGAQFSARLYMSALGDGGVHVALCDVTTSKRLEEERHDGEVAFLQAQKLESLGLLAGGVAHDFNNLLHSILGYAALAEERLPAGSRALSHLQAVIAAGRQATGLTSKLLAYAGEGTVARDPLDLSAIVEDASALLQSAVSKKVRLVFDLTADLPRTQGDAVQILQVLINMVTNASEACGRAGGVVTVRTYSKPGASSPPTASTSPVVVLECTDTGGGMDEETRSKVFEPFFTTKPLGRGLGLAATQGIVRRHDATIEVESRVGLGTTFRVTFPGFEPAADPPQQPARSASDWRGSGTILLVEDQAEIRRLAQKCLEELGFTVLAAEDGQAGVELFQARHAEIDCVLLDNRMPRLSGAEAYAAMREVKAVPVILCSGYSEEESVRDLTERGLAGFLPKPYEFEALREKLRQVLSS